MGVALSEVPSIRARLERKRKRFESKRNNRSAGFASSHDNYCCGGRPLFTRSCPSVYQPSGSRPEVAKRITGLPLRGSSIPTRKSYVPSESVSGT